MAIYRLHRREWERGRVLQLPASENSDRTDLPRTQKKRKRSNDKGDNDLPGGKKRLGSRVSTVVKRMDPPKTKSTSLLASKKKAEWWSELGSSKGSLRIS